jgi:hypothetical protein
MVVVVDVIYMVGRCASWCGGSSGGGGCTGDGGGGGQGHKLSHFIFSVFVY